MWWIYVGCLLRDVGEKHPCDGKKYQVDLGSFLIITSQCVAEKIDVVDRFQGVVDRYNQILVCIHSRSFLLVLLSYLS